jgi:hypothetical protein
MTAGNSQFLRPRGFAPRDRADTVEVGAAMRVFADRARENGEAPNMERARSLMVLAHQEQALTHLSSSTRLEG